MEIAGSRPSSPSPLSSSRDEAAVHVPAIGQQPAGGPLTVQGGSALGLPPSLAGDVYPPEKQQALSAAMLDFQRSRGSEDTKAPPASSFVTGYVHEETPPAAKPEQAEPRPADPETWQAPGGVESLLAGYHGLGPVSANQSVAAVHRLGVEPRWLEALETEAVRDLERLPLSESLCKCCGVGAALLVWMGDRYRRGVLVGETRDHVILQVAWDPAAHGAVPKVAGSKYAHQCEPSRDGVGFELLYATGAVGADLRRDPTVGDKMTPQPSPSSAMSMIASGWGLTTQEVASLPSGTPLLMKVRDAFETVGKAAVLLAVSETDEQKPTIRVLSTWRPADPVVMVVRPVDGEAEPPEERLWRSLPDEASGGFELFSCESVVALGKVDGLPGDDWYLSEFDLDQVEVAVNPLLLHSATDAPGTWPWLRRFDALTVGGQPAMCWGHAEPNKDRPGGYDAIEVFKAGTQADPVLKAQAGGRVRSHRILPRDLGTEPAHECYQHVSGHIYTVAIPMPVRRSSVDTLAEPVAPSRADAPSSVDTTGSGGSPRSSLASSANADEPAQRGDTRPS